MLAVPTTRGFHFVMDGTGALFVITKYYYYYYNWLLVGGVYMDIILI